MFSTLVIDVTYYCKWCFLLLYVMFITFVSDIFSIIILTLLSDVS